MSSDETAVNPTGTKDGAKHLHFAGQHLGAQWTRLAAQIRSLNDAKPWGTDEPGTEFNKNYLDGGEEAPALMTLKAGDNLVERVKDLGGQVAMSVDGTLDIDDLTAKWFGGGDDK